MTYEKRPGAMGAHRAFKRDQLGGDHCENTPPTSPQQVRCARNLLR
jgi:hypothetical protein